MNVDLKAQFAEHLRLVAAVANPHLRKHEFPYQCDLVLCRRRLKRSSKELSALKRFESEIRKLGLLVERVPCSSRRSRVEFSKVTATDDFLFRTAETLNVVVPVAPNDMSTVKPPMSKLKAWIFGIRPLKSVSPCPFEDTLKVPYHRNMHRHYVDHDNPKLFSPLQRTQMVKYELDRLSVGIKQVFVSPECCGETDNVRCMTDDSVETKITYDWLKARNIYTAAYVCHDGSLKMGSCDQSECPSMRCWLKMNWANLRMMFHEQPVHEIKEYFGPKIAFYFGWMEFYTTMLRLPAFISILLFLVGIGIAFRSEVVTDSCSEHAKDIIMCRPCPALHCKYSLLSSHCNEIRFSQISDNDTIPLYAVCLSIWAACFLHFWHRKQAYYKSDWLISEKLKPGRDLRGEFIGRAETTKTNGITGEAEPGFQRFTRLRLRAISWSLVALVACVVAMIEAGLVAVRNIIRANASVMAFDKNHLLPVSADFIADVVASFLTLVVISICDFIFPKIARRLTELEIPRTHEDFEKSYCIKIVVLQFMNYYASLFYIAFISGKRDLPPHLIDNRLYVSCGAEGCLFDIMVQLVVILTLRQLMRIMFRALGPTVWMKLHRLYAKTSGRAPKQQWERDYLLLQQEEPVAFSEYTHKIIQYGLITMFSVSFPICTLFAYFANLIEIRLDAMRFLHDYRRPVPTQATDIGTWRDVLEYVTRFSILINAVLMSFNSFGLEVFYYKVSGASGSHSTFFDFYMSVFNTSDYLSNRSTLMQQEYVPYPLLGIQVRSEDFASKLRRWGNETVTSCYYRGKFFHPDEEDGIPYEHSYYYTDLLFFRLLHVFLLQNFVLMCTAIVGQLLPGTPEKIEKKHEREHFLYHQLLLQAEKSDSSDSSDSIEIEPSSPGSDRKASATSFGRSIWTAAHLSKKRMYAMMQSDDSSHHDDGDNEIQHFADIHIPTETTIPANALPNRDSRGAFPSRGCVGDVSSAFTATIRHIMGLRR